MSRFLEHPIMLIGAGRMGGALVSGWLKSGISGASIRVVESNPSGELLAMANSGGVAVSTTPLDMMQHSAIILAVKPQAMADVVKLVRPIIRADTLVISIAAGKSFNYFEAALGEVALVRAMPNTPAVVGRGVTGAIGNARVTNKHHQLCDALLGAIGNVEWLKSETDIDAVTALSGSGPAYLFYAVECMAQAGVALGLDRALAMRLARHTFIGSAELLDRSNDDLRQLRENVTSPGGTTAAGLSVLTEKDSFQKLIIAAVGAARRRAHELAS